MKLKAEKNVNVAVEVDGKPFITSTEGVLFESISDSTALLYIKNQEGNKEIMEVLHIKSGRTYTVLSNEIINATNEQDGQNMILYYGEKKDGSGPGYFVREQKEFFEKFKII